MKSKLVIAFIFMAVLGSSSYAVEWQDRTGWGVRGPIFIPLMKGSNFSQFGGEFETFGMGWDGTVFLDHGLSNRFVLELSLGFVRTYDDSTATDNQSFSLYNTDNALARLNGTLLGVTGKYFLSPDARTQPYLIFGVGMDFWKLKNWETERSYKVQDFVGKLGAGANFWLSENLAASVEARFSYGLEVIKNDLPTDAYGPGRWDDWDNRPFRAYLEPAVSIAYYFGGTKDTDKDGVNDKKDQCPNTPLGAIVDAAGCPMDADGDGVFDGLDVCPNTPSGAKVDSRGCPLDGDKDGVFDGLDKCPDTPDKAPVDKLGCPLDSDGDGVFDYKDLQIDTPRGAVVDKDGVGIDTDKDGFYDGIDKCPKNAIGLVVDEFGCPKEVKMITEKIVLDINYASNSFEPDAAAKRVLDSVVTSLKAFPYMKITISGFTDSQGPEAANQSLSEKRAGGVKDYLVSKGIESQRLSVIGHGEDAKYFVGDNNTPAGRRANRRVEIESAGE